MLLDLLSSDNYISFNIDIANTFGLQQAVYLSEIIRISAKAIRKSKLDSDSYFDIDREYIQKRTTISISEQLEMDKCFIKLKIISKPKSDSDKMAFNSDVLISLMKDDSETLNKDIKTIVAKTSKSSKTKREYQRDNLKKYVAVPNLELRDAYEDWVDAVYANPTGFLSGGIIKIFMDTVDEFSNHDLDVALDVIKIATAGGYREASWAIDKYKQTNKKSYSSVNRDSIKEQAGVITTI